MRHVPPHIRQHNRTLTQEHLERLIHAFSLIKAEDDELLAQFPDSIFVQTEAYHRVALKTKRIVVGRKGVGKSAVARTYLLLNKVKFCETIPLNADDLMIDRICDLLFAGKRLHSDLKISSDRVATVAWIRAITFFALSRAIEWTLKIKDLSQDKRVSLLTANSFLHDQRATAFQSQTESHGLFHSFLDQAFTFLAHLSDDLLETPEQQKATQGARLEQFFEPLPAAIAPAISIVSEQPFTMLITLDEFDDFVDSFMREHPQFERREALSDLFKGLILAVKRLNAVISLRWLHLLIAVPEDKLLELRLREAATVDQFTLPLSWKPRELKALVENRLRHVLGTAAHWNELFGFPVSNKNPSVAAKEPSLAYLIRHTNRKPRELMAHLKALFERIADEGVPADETMFQEIVEATNEEIVERQFIPEFIAEYPSLDRLLLRLKSVRLLSVMSLSELLLSIGKFSAWESIHEKLSPIETVRRLFHMGIIGLRETTSRTTANTVRQQGSNVVYHFSYNGTSENTFNTAIKDLPDEVGQSGQGARVSQFDIVVSPMFFEYLRVEHRQSYIIGELSNASGVFA